MHKDLGSKPLPPSANSGPSLGQGLEIWVCEGFVQVLLMVRWFRGRGYSELLAFLRALTLSSLLRLSLRISVYVPADC